MRRALNRSLSLLLLICLTLPAQAQTARKAGNRTSRAARAEQRTWQQAYICNGPYARKYHRSARCAGARCSASVSGVSLGEASRRMAGPCLKCW